MAKRIPNSASRLVWALAAAAVLQGSSAIAQPEQSPAPTEQAIAASPAAERLKALVEAVNSGDASVMQAFLQANAVDPAKPPPGPPNALPLAGSIIDLHRRSRGLEIVRFDKLEAGEAVATVRNRLTGDTQALAVKTEPEAPHRLTSFGLPLPDGKEVRPVAVGLSEQARLQLLKAYLQRLGDAEVFSGVVVIARDGKPVLAEAHGYADRERKIPNAIDRPFLLGSMDKLFTSLAIGRLVEQGMLSYDDPLAKFVPDFPDPDNARRIRIKHLLSHTSGLEAIGDPSSTPRWMTCAPSSRSSTSPTGIHPSSSPGQNGSIAIPGSSCSAG